MAWVCVMGMHAQTSYQNKLKELFNANTTLMNLDAEQQVDAYANMLKMGGMGEADAKALCQKYFSTQFMNDMVEVVSPYYEKVLSEADINSLIEQLNTPAGKLSTNHIGKATKQMSSPEAQGFMQKAMMSILQGQKAEEVKPEACSAVYQQKFNEYYTVTNTAANITSVISSLEPALMGQAQTSEQKTQMRNLLNSLSSFLTTNMKTFALNTFHPEVTEADLDFYINFSKSPAGQNLIKGGSAMTKDAMNMGTKLVEKFTLWVAKQQSK